MPTVLFFLVSLFVSLTMTWRTFASDHIDGVPTLGVDQQVDLTDLYFFKDSTDSSKVNLVLNMYPGVSAKGHLSSKVSYDFLLKAAQVSVPPVAPGIHVRSDDSLLISCDYDDNHPNQFDCKVSSQQEGQVAVELAEIAGGINQVIQEGPLKAFVGQRADPFFISQGHFDFLTQLKSGAFPKPTKCGGLAALNPLAGNLMKGLNIFSIVLQLDLDELNFKPTDTWPLLAVAAQSYSWKDNGQGQMQKVVHDRIGRAELTNMGIPQLSSSAQSLKPLFNSFSPFFHSLEKLANGDVETEVNFNLFADRLKNNIKKYDELKDQNSVSQTDWNDEQLELYGRMAIEDALVMDISKACSDAGDEFLSIEKSILKGEIANSCGGRQLNDNIVETLHSLYIGGPFNLGNLFNTGVSSAYECSKGKSVSMSFPFLSAPYKTQNPIKVLILDGTKKSQEGSGHGVHGH